ncbi:MAG: hypothetical protein CSA32_01285 [Desulfobulbus propionicus]|nr:MAG: hypothetical protein CSA32_01285 [Desulfobulbus propionicus]
MPQPVQRRKRSLSPIWILPLVALCLGSWLLYTGIRDAGAEIKVHFTDAQGITAGKTKVMFKGIAVGTVTQITIDEAMEGVDLVIQMENWAKPLLVKDTRFWLVTAEVSAGRVRGLETLIGGTYIGLQMGESSEPASIFTGLDSPPPLDPARPGLRLTLEAESLYSLERNSKIFTKNLPIGHIEDYSLQDNGKILFNIYIEPAFAQLIKKGTRFWNSSGVSLTGNLRQGLTVNMESVASLIYGGISCATPESLEQSGPASPHTHFTLYKDFEAAEYGIPMTLRIISGDGIVPGKTQVLFRGLKVGIVKKLSLNDDRYHTVQADILLDPGAELILREHTRFWVVKPEVSLLKVTNLETIIAGNYITFIPGDGSFRNRFTEEPDPMPSRVTREGKTFRLMADDTGSLKSGRPVLYKRKKIGEIISTEVVPESDKVLITVFVYAPYDVLVFPKTVFWNVSGLRIDGKLSGLKVSMTSLEAFLSGGISFTTPEGAEKAPPAAENSVFTLYGSYDQAAKANWQLQPAGLRLTLTSEKAVPVTAGSPILYKNVKVGEVTAVALAKKDIFCKVLIENDYRYLVNSSSRFYTDSGIRLDASIQGFKLHTGSVASILSGGISFITPATGATVKNDAAFPMYTGYEAARQADHPRLNLYFGHGKSVTEGTAIIYQGVKIGKVDSISFNEEATAVIAQARIDPKTAKFFRSKTKLYIMRPEVSLHGIKNIDTVLTGPYIHVEAGAGPPCRTFSVLEDSARLREPLSGLNIILESPQLGSLTTGSPVCYRQMVVGRVTGHELAPTKQSVWISVNIDPAYTDLVYAGTKFWITSGLRLNGGLLGGVTVATESLEAFLRGGLSLATPEGDAAGQPAAEGDHFTLARQAEPEWLTWCPVLPPGKGTNTM